MLVREPLAVGKNEFQDIARAPVVRLDATEADFQFAAQPALEELGLQLFDRPVEAEIVDRVARGPMQQRAVRPQIADHRQAEHRSPHPDEVRIPAGPKQRFLQAAPVCLPS